MTVITETYDGDDWEPEGFTYGHGRENYMYGGIEWDGPRAYSNRGYGRSRGNYHQGYHGRGGVSYGEYDNGFRGYRGRSYQNYGRGWYGGRRQGRQGGFY